MKCNWIEKKLGDLIESVSIKHKFDKKEIILINTSDVLEGKVLNHTHVENSDLRGQFKKSFMKGDILYSEIRPQNKRFAFVDFDSEDYVASTKLMVLRRKTDEITEQFLFQILKSNNLIRELQAIAESRSGTFPQITFSELSNITILLPPREEQERIVNTLSSLDKKYELNKEIIETLEETASTLFKHWFVDFEFPDKKGNPYKSSGGKMVESELGEIPEGWEVKQLKDITNYSNKAFNPKKENAKKVAHFSLPAFDSKTFPVIDETESIKSNKYYIDDSSIMVSKMNPNTPRIWLPNISKIYENVCSSEFIVLKSTNQNKKSFIYELCKSDKFTNFLISNATGSTNSRQRVTPSMAIRYTFPWNENKVEEYGEMIKNKHLLILELREQNINLLSLRDTLLPKLISGEIELPTEEEV